MDVQRTKVTAELDVVPNRESRAGVVPDNYDADLGGEEGPMSPR